MAALWSVPFSVDYITTTVAFEFATGTPPPLSQRGAYRLIPILSKADSLGIPKSPAT